MISRRSSGSMRAESAVEPTRSENITVTWRRSAVSWVFSSVAAMASESGSFGHRNEGRDRLQQPLAMAERRDAHILEIVVCQPTQQLAVDVVGAKHLGILGETDPAEPTVDVQVQSPRLLSAAVFEMGRVMAPAVIPRGFSNQPWIRHVDANHSTAA